MDKELNSQDSFYEDFWKDASYQRAYAFDSAVRDRFPAISQVWGNLRKPARVLDFGCGNGVLTFWLHCNGFGDDVLGVDISATGVQNAKVSFSRPGLRYELVSCMEEFDASSFDAVVSSHVLEHIEQPEAALRFLSAKAEWIVVEVPLEKCFVPSMIAVLKGRSRKDNALGHVNFWSKSTFNQFLSDNGLLVVKDYQYASAPFSPYNSSVKRWIERALLALVGLRAYGWLMATHYIVLARKQGL